MELGYLDQSTHRPTHADSLKGIELGVVGLDDRDYEHRLRIINHPNGTVEFTQGMCYDLLLTLQLSLSFKYRAIRGMRWWGRNTTIAGMGGQVHYREADLCIGQASMVMMIPALNYLSFLIPTSYGKLTVIFKQPRSTTDLISNVFSYQIWVWFSFVWVCIAVTWITFNHIFSKFSILGKSCYDVDMKSNNNEATKISRTSNHNVAELCLWCFAIMCCKGWYNQPKEASTKSVVLVGMAFAIIISVFFSASLTSNLATETMPIKSFADLASSKLELNGDERLPLVREIVKDVYVKRRGSRFNQGNPIESHYTHVNESIQSIIKSPSAFITFEDAAKSASVSSKQGYSAPFFCETISAMSVTSGTFPTAMFVRKGSYLREAINRKIIILIERGVIFRLNTIYNKKTLLLCARNDDHYRGGLGFTDLYTAYLIAAFGVLLCVGAILLEKLTFRNNNLTIPFPIITKVKRNIFPQKSESIHRYYSALVGAMDLFWYIYWQWTPHLC